MVMKKREAFVEHFRELHPKFSRFYANMLNRVNLSLPQYVLLNQLCISGTISMTEASKRLRITKPAVTNLVDRLEEKELLKRVPHSKDRRIILLELLPKARKVVSRVQGRMIVLLLEAYDQFNEEEHKVIRRFTATLSGILDTVLNEEGE